MSSTSLRSTQTSSSYTTSYQTSLPLNPLTAFTPPTDCSGLYAPTSGIAVFDPVSSCLPPSFTQGTTNFFSPGTTCPSGYLDAGHDTIGASSLTTVTCCPSRSGLALSRVTKIRDPFWANYFCTWTPTAPVTLSVTVSSNGGVTSTSSMSFTSGLGINAYGVRMVYQSSDMAATATSSSSSSSTSATITGTMTSSSSEPTGATHGTSGPTTSPRIIIVVAVVVPVLVLAILGGLFWWWRRRRVGYKAPRVQAELPGHDPSWGTGELKKGGASGGEPGELPVPERPAELGTYR